MKRKILIGTVAAALGLLGAAAFARSPKWRRLPIRSAMNTQDGAKPRGLLLIE
jgi:hypothetical protein